MNHLIFKSFAVKHDFSSLKGKRDTKHCFDKLLRRSIIKFSILLVFGFHVKGFSFVKLASSCSELVFALALASDSLFGRQLICWS